MTGYEYAKEIYEMLKDRDLLKRDFLDQGAITEEQYKEIIGEE